MGFDTLNLTSFAAIRLQIDHIIPYDLGGETTVENSQTLCSVCNRE
jgi:5-methylcytosine-specific restriction endonuclease McrA